MKNPYTSFHPPVRTLMGPGPSDVHPRVLQASARPTIGHLDPEFIRMMDEVKVMLQQAFLTDNALTMPISAPGSAGMEACFVNLIEAGDQVIVCRNGVFGERMRLNVERCGATAIMVDDEWGDPVSPEKVEEALKANPEAKAVAFVHAETSTGALSDAQTICALAKQYNCLSIVDAVTSFGGSELRVDDWGIDAIYSGSQKCLSCLPGISPVSFSAQAVNVIKSRKTPVQSWFLDMSLIMGYWGESNNAGKKRSYHHTAPVNALYALHESLVMLHEEGLEHAWQRHHDMHQLLKAGLEELGFEYIGKAGARLNQLNAVKVPAGVDEAVMRSRLLNEYNLEIGGGLGALAGKVVRIGLMGHAARKENVALCLAALKEVLG